MTITTHFTRRIVLPFALAGALAGCESALDDPTAPATPERIAATDGHVYTPAAALVTRAELASEWIDARGGRVSIGGHAIVVPAGAVGGPTRFAVEVVRDGRIHVELTATSADGRDVGAAGFAVPVELRLSFAAAGRLPGTPAVLRLGENGRLAEALASSVDRSGRVVSARLGHFSGYIVVVG